MKKILKTFSTIALSLSLLSIVALPTLASEVGLSSTFSNPVVTTILTKTVKTTKVILNKKTTSINVGDNEILTSTVLPTTATNKKTTWKSSNTKIATVENGIVKAIKAGKTTITVTTVDSKKTASCVVVVTIANYPVTFKDANLEKAVRNSIKKPTGVLYGSDVQKITNLNLEVVDLVDIGGIESLTNLKTLGLGNNKISDITPLRGLTKLKTLFL